MILGRVIDSGIIYECIEIDGMRRAEAIGRTAEAGNELCFREFVALYGKKFPLKKIGGFEGWNGVKVTIPNSVEELGDRCFCKCSSLRQVIFGAEPMLRRIVDTASYGRDLPSGVLPSSAYVVSTSDPAANANWDSELERTEHISAAHQ
jgi:hypothetical protein